MRVKNVNFSRGETPFSPFFGKNPRRTKKPVCDLTGKLRPRHAAKPLPYEHAHIKREVRDPVCRLKTEPLQHALHCRFPRNISPQNSAYAQHSDYLFIKSNLATFCQHFATLFATFCQLLGRSSTTFCRVISPVLATFCQREGRIFATFRRIGLLGGSTLARRKSGMPRRVTPRFRVSS